MAICQGTPADRWRTTTQSTPIASMVWTVSRTDSPLLTEDEETEKFMVSADSRRAAASKDSRVRVESSKKSQATVLPRSAGTRGIWRATDLHEGVGEAEHVLDAVGTEIGDGEQVGHLRISPRCTPSIVTSTTSSRRVGRFLPT